MNTAKKAIFSIFAGFIGVLCISLLITSFNSGGMGLMAGPGGSNPMASPGFISQDTASSSYAQLNSEYVGFRLNANGYFNFASTTGADGYGIRDNSGTLQFKNYGGSWSGVSSVASINDLSDVSITTATSGEILVFDGSNWANVATSTLGVAIDDTTGTLSVTRGGTGITTIAQGQFLYGISSDTIAATSSIFIDTNGNIGIGTTTPQRKLVVVGDIEATGDIYASSSSIYLGDTALSNDGGSLLFGGASVGGGSEVGSIIIYASSTAPDGYLACDGTAVSRTTYADLFAIVGTTYGVGDGSTTFNLPDTRGRVVVDKSADSEFDVMGETGGEKTHTLTTDEMPSHRHSITMDNTEGGGSGNIDAGDTQTGATGYTNYTGSDGAHNNIQPYIVFFYMIKY